MKGVKTMSGNHTGEANELNEMATVEAEKESFKGARIPLKELEREDGVITEAVSKTIGRANMGVLLKAMTAVESDKEYRQILKFGNYRTREKARQAVKAIDECRRFGYEDGITAILDDITAQSAGENMELLRAVFETLTHTTFTTNSIVSRKKGDDSRSASPLS